MIRLFKKKKNKLAFIATFFIVLVMASFASFHFLQGTSGSPQQDFSQLTKDFDRFLTAFHEGDMSKVADTSTASGKMLLAGGTRIGSNFAAKLALGNEGKIVSRSNELKNFSNAVVETISWNGSVWFIGGGDPFLRPASRPRLNSFDGEKFTDLSSRISTQKGNLSKIENNGSYWLLGINSTGDIAGVGGLRENTVLKYTDEAVTELISSDIFPHLQEAGLTDIKWGGGNWLVAYRTFPGLDPPKPGGDQKSKLFRYDGSGVKELNPIVDSLYSIFSIGWNEEKKYWLIPVYRPTYNRTEFWKFDGYNDFSLLPFDFPEGQIATSVIWAKDHWLIATTTLGNYEAGINKVPFTGSGIIPRAAALWRYDGQRLYGIPLASPMMVIYDLERDSATDRIVISGIKPSGKAGLLAYDPPHIPSYPDGTLLRSQGSPEIYVVHYQRLRHIPNLAAFNASAFKWQNVKEITQDELNLMPRWVLMRETNNPKVYYIDKGQKRPLDDLSVFNSYGLEWKDVLVTSGPTLNSYPTARLFKERNSDRVFYITTNGFRHHILSPEVFNSYKNRWEDIVEVTPLDMTSYEVSSLIRKRGDTKVYRIIEGKKHWIETYDALKRFGYDPKKVHEVNEVEFAAYETGSPLK